MIITAPRRRETTPSDGMRAIRHPPAHQHSPATTATVAHIIIRRQRFSRHIHVYNLAHLCASGRICHNNKLATLPHNHRHRYQPSTIPTSATLTQYPQSPPPFLCATSLPEIKTSAGKGGLVASRLSTLGKLQISCVVRSVD
jgi:hypothetical protein